MQDRGLGGRLLPTNEEAIMVQPKCPECEVIGVEHFMTKEGEPSFRWIDKDFAAERGITEAQFHDVIDRVEKFYKPIIAAHGATIGMIGNCRLAKGPRGHGVGIVEIAPEFRRELAAHARDVGGLKTRVDKREFEKLKGLVDVACERLHVS